MLRSFLFGLIVGILTTSFVLHEPRTESVFVYGTLKSPIVRSLACWCYTPTKPAALEGFAIQGLNIVPVENSMAAGAVFKVSSRELVRLDRYERVPHRYSRESVEIAGTEHWVYRRNQ